MNGQSLRACADELVKSAAEAGFSGAWRLTEHTPREIRLELEAFARERRREAELADLIAWRTGRYVLCALHAPRRYPRRPDLFGHRKQNMTDEEMKRVFAAMVAERRGNGGC